MKVNNPYDKAPKAKTGKDIINLLLSKGKQLDVNNIPGPTDDIEIFLFTVWKGLLGHGNFSVRNDFF